MSSESVSTCESPAAAPLRAALQLAFADEFLLAAMEPFMAFTIMLPCECLAADCTDKRSLVCVSPEMRPKIVSSREALRAKRALERRRMFLNAATIFGAVRWRAIGFCKIENVPCLQFGRLLIERL